MGGVQWGCEGTRGERGLRPVKSPASAYPGSNPGPATTSHDQRRHGSRPGSDAQPRRAGFPSDFPPADAMRTPPGRPAPLGPNTRSISPATRVRSAGAGGGRRAARSRLRGSVNRAILVGRDAVGFTPESVCGRQRSPRQSTEKGARGTAGAHEGRSKGGTTAQRNAAVSDLCLICSCAPVGWSLGAVPLFRAVRCPGSPVE